MSLLIINTPEGLKVTSREQALLTSLEEALQDLASERIERALSCALVAELQEQVGKAGASEEIAAEKISALELEVSKRQNDDATNGERITALEAELARTSARLQGVGAELERLMNGAVNLPKLPHELNGHLARIRALALPAEKG